MSYPLLVCDVGSVGGACADGNTWRHRCAGQEVGILVVSVLNVQREDSRRVEVLRGVGFLCDVMEQNKASGRLVSTPAHLWLRCQVTYLGPDEQLQLGPALVVQRSVQDDLSTVGQIDPEEASVALQGTGHR